MKRSPAALALSLLLASAWISRAGEDAVATQAPPPEHYRELWANSPFLRPLNAAESYVLTGAVRIDSKPMVTMLNTATGERFTLTPDGNSLGWKLLDLREDPNPRNVTARVAINGEEVALRFSDKQVSAEALFKASDGSGRSLPTPAPRALGGTLGERKPARQNPAPKSASFTSSTPNSPSKSRDTQQKKRPARQ